MFTYITAQRPLTNNLQYTKHDTGLQILAILHDHIAPNLILNAVSWTYFGFTGIFQ